MAYRVVQYENGRLHVLDQTVLPHQENFVELENLAQVEHAIRTLQVRGAPLIGVTAGFGVCVGLKELPDDTPADQVRSRGREVVERLSRTRPTAVNLFWALERMAAVLAGLDGPNWRSALDAEAEAIFRETLDQDARMADHGMQLLSAGERAITHCNTGPLATGGGGTALGVLIEAHRRLGGLHVYADETRPRWQGAHLTTWELMRHGVPHTLICDNMAAALMRTRGVDSVWVGADRIAANGDTANKIGTYGLAVAARHHGVPFYVVAPTSTIDPALESGEGIPIEERDPAEVSAPGGHRISPGDTPVWNPAFDVTPAELVSAIITEQGVFRGPEYDFRRPPSEE